MQIEQIYDSESFGMELFTVFIYVYALAMATLHECRRNDEYQNTLLYLCWMVLSAMHWGWISAVTLQGETAPGDSSLAPNVLVLAFALCLTASAVLHMSINFRNKRVGGRSGQDSMRSGEKTPGWNQEGT